MANDSGLNTSEVQEALDAATTEEEKRYLERVLESRGVRKASVSSHEIVAGNPDAYPDGTVEQQEDLADGRPHEPVAPEDLAVRGSVGDPEADAAADRPPAKSASKADWEAYARSQGATDADLDGKTRDDLVNAYGAQA